MNFILKLILENVKWVNKIWEVNVEFVESQRTKKNLFTSLLKKLLLNVKNVQQMPIVSVELKFIHKHTFEEKNEILRILKNVLK